MYDHWNGIQTGATQNWGGLKQNTSEPTNAAVDREA